MSLGWVIAGTFGQLMLAFFMFMMAVFAGGGIANGNNLSKLEIAVLDLSMLALPGSCVISAGVVIYLYVADAGPSSYWWYGLPAAVVAAYAMFVSELTRNRASRNAKNARKQ